METRVTNTINGDVQVFENAEMAQQHVASEIKWFNSPGENERNDGYDNSDFIVEEVRFVICDNTQNSGKPYISDDLSNTGDCESAWIFKTQEDAQKVIDSSNWDWAYIQGI